ncbi:zinc finger protein zfat-like [Lynx pardinus]|uniref:Zinc finger protein zfat-like n=1 Tax=Lynx pardinus TaxID=191816 RepID=A0A485NCE9_LYNPA|nr:zinc finger protein zfat-like [Lynx pardinus]
METRAAAENTAIFMCKCCNLFSPNQSELLSHVSEKHAGEGVNADEIIIPLRPLSTPEPTNPHKSGDEFSVMKRKRGRPKGSTKKPSGEEELAESVVSPREGSPPAPEEGSSLAPGSLECGQCRRKFSNPRQLRKHVCIIVLNWGEEDGDAGDESDLELERKYKEDDREKTPRRPRTQRTEKVQKISSGKEAGQVSGVKKPIISVVLTAHEAIPGATKIVPVEAGPPETGTANPEATPADLAPRRGYQEYAIQQTPYEQPMKSSRLGCRGHGFLDVTQELDSPLRLLTSDICLTLIKRGVSEALLSTFADFYLFIKKIFFKVFIYFESEREHVRTCAQLFTSKRIRPGKMAHLIVSCKTSQMLEELGYGAFHGCLFSSLVPSCAPCGLWAPAGVPAIWALCTSLTSPCKCLFLISDDASPFPGLVIPFTFQLSAQVSSARDSLPGVGPDLGSWSTLPFPITPGSRSPLSAPFRVFLRAFMDNLDILSSGSIGTEERRPHLPVCHLSIPVPGACYSTSAAIIHWLQKQGRAIPTALEVPYRGLSLCIQLLWGGGLAYVVFAGIIEEEEEHAGSRGRQSAWGQILASPLANCMMCLRSNPGEASDLPPVAGGGEVAPPQPDSCSPASEHRAGVSAFMKILDGLQKRRMNTGLCERIRKVYGDLECEYCGKLFWYQVHFDMHVRTHTREHLYHCSQCHYSSITKNCLKRHVIQKHSNVLLKCPTDGCNYSTPDKYKLQAHLKVHTELDKRSYSCPVCEKSFSEDRLIKSHIKTNHPEVSMSTISEVLGRRVQLKGLIGKRAMKCPYCDFYFMKNGSDLQRHIWAHEGVKPFKCSLCEYATRSKSNLKAHMNRHSTEKTHLCDMCGKKFKSKGTLKSHKLLHTADALPLCPLPLLL